MPFPYLRQYKLPRGLTALEYLKLATSKQGPVLLVAISYVAINAIMMYKAFTYEDMGIDVKRYKLHYTVYRHDDPRVARIKE